MDGSEKLPHVVTGNTPNKPNEKRPREQEVEGASEERLARRTLAFQEKGACLFPWPLICLFSDFIFTQHTALLQQQLFLSLKVSRGILRKAKLVRSPESPKQLISPQKRKTVAIS